jgi:transcriptional regulator with XRE-family HTH domain|tara:strand:+ start:344 stop:562 length:219 start_codon:yes stop_codon:yes gene_type:complete
MSISKHFGATVRITRKTLNMTQEELADTAGINRSHMGQIERGKKNANIETIARIAKALHCSAGQLLDYTESD